MGHFLCPLIFKYRGKSAIMSVNNYILFIREGFYMIEILFYITMFFVMINARVNLIEMRSNIPELNSNLFKVIISFASTIASLSIIVWGFLNLEWWIPIVALIGMSFFAVLLVNKQRYAFFYAISLIIDIILIGLSVFIWFN